MIAFHDDAAELLSFEFCFVHRVVCMAIENHNVFDHYHMMLELK